jgi:hypothetical protein
LINTGKAMKNRIIKSGKTSKINQIRLFLLFLTSSAMALILTGFSTVSAMNDPQVNYSREKKLDLLEKIESGRKISSDDIWSSYTNKVSDNSIQKNQEVIMPECCESSDPCPKSCPFIYHGYKGKDHVIITDEDIRNIQRKLSESVEVLKREIQSFRNSDDYIHMQNDLRKWKDEFRKDIEKMKEEIIRSDKDSEIKVIEGI